MTFLNYLFLVFYDSAIEMNIKSKYIEGSHKKTK